MDRLARLLAVDDRVADFVNLSQSGVVKPLGFTSTQ
jgi:hypothetical protein